MWWWRVDVVVVVVCGGDGWMWWWFSGINCYLHCIYGVPDTASNCYLHKGRPFNICMHALMQVTIASCIGHSNGARACPDPL